MANTPRQKNKSINQDCIKILGARTHNLKNITLTLPRNQLIVITGLSGSGKSSLAFDTLYAEGQRRYVESLSAYARQFLSIMEKPEVDSISGLSPAIAIEQKTASHNPRSTVGTTTEIYDYLRLLFARVGQPRCPKHGIILEAQSVAQICNHLTALPLGTTLHLLAPVIDNQKGGWDERIERLKQKGFIRFRVNGTLIHADDLKPLDPHQKHKVEVVIDRLKLKEDSAIRLADSLQTAIDIAKGVLYVTTNHDEDQKELLFSTDYACPKCQYSLETLEPKLFSFNNPHGACKQCDGLGHTQFFDPDKVIIDPQLSLSEGAIRGWDEKHPYYYSMLTCLAQQLNFSLHTPFASLPKTTQQIILYGSKDKKITFSMPTIKSRYRNRHKQHTFKGIVPTMEKRYKDTESEAIKKQLAAYLTDSQCPSCEGSRLNTAANNVFVDQYPLATLVKLPLDQLEKTLKKINITGHKKMIAESILKEINARVHFLVNVGLNYLSLSRTSETLSGGESQRIRLASQIGSGLMGVMYVLDEPSIGLHQRDNQRLLDTLITLRDLGNTVIVVEHDEETMLQADHLVDIGPGAGIHGGHIIFSGPPKELSQQTGSITADYLNGTQYIPVPKTPLKADANKVLKIIGAYANNLNKIDVTIPCGLITCVTGVSGSGKSSLINHTLYPYMKHMLQHQVPGNQKKCTTIHGIQYFNHLIRIDQSPIGRTPRSNPATYTGMFSAIRELFAKTVEARARGYSLGRFSFNVASGRCPTCEGDGLIRVAMHFLADLFVTCSTCQGKRYNPQTLEIQYKGKTIADVLDLTIEEAQDFFNAHPKIAAKCTLLCQVGLSYMKLGQSATTLSGGEAQRIKLTKELSKRSQGQTLYLLDEPTTGLHTHDIKHLLEILKKLRDQGNTIIVIEHNLDVIKTADWLVDIGPEGGSQGGNLLYMGPPRTLITLDTPTAHALKGKMIPRKSSSVKSSQVKIT
jgi:excinuclease ABC subunit A